MTLYYNKIHRTITKKKADINTGAITIDILLSLISNRKMKLLRAIGAHNNERYSLQDNGTSFTDSDVSIFEAFAIFCGLGIHNTQMYESACKLMAKQKVALECLSYHATANNEDALRLVSDPIPSAETYNLYSFTFIDFDLTDEDTCRATIRMFKQCDLIQKFHIPYDVLCRWILSVKKNYR